MRSALVTGTTSAFGSAIVAELVAQGMVVYATARDPERARRYLGALGDNDAVRVQELDVTSPASVAAAVQAIESTTGPVDVVVNNASIGVVQAVEQTDDDDVLRLFDTNVIGAVRVIRGFAPAMRRRGRGTIVNVTGLCGLAPLPFLSVYSATKAALEAMTVALDEELRPANIRVVAVRPAACADMLASLPSSTHAAASDDASEPMVSAYERVAAATAAADVARMVAGVVDRADGCSGVVVPAPEADADLLRAVDEFTAAASELQQATRTFMGA